MSSSPVLKKPQKRGAAQPPRSTSALHSFNESLLKGILDQPTAPFRELLVMERICRELDLWKVPYFFDRYRNLVVGSNSATQYERKLKTKGTTLRIFIAHTDHPGFHGISWEKARPKLKTNATHKTLLNVQWHGGSPFEHLHHAKVWLADNKGWKGTGKLQKVEMLKPHGKSIATAQVLLDDDSLSKTNAKNLFGGFQFRNTHWEDHGNIYTKAADDLVGSFAITNVAIQLYSGLSPKSQEKVPFIGVLTRGEEVGFIGWLGHLKLGYLQKAKRPLFCVSLETSRALVGAEIGKGPVVRLGDRSTVFSANALQILLEAAENAIPNRYQKRVMDGGTCEASPAVAYGFPTVGISVPLGNYHNQSFEGGPDSAGPNGPAPEFVSKADIEGLLKICLELSKNERLSWKNPWKLKQEVYEKNFKKYAKYLAEK